MRTESGKSSGLEKEGRRERISYAGPATAVLRVAREAPPLLGISARLADDQRALGPDDLAERVGFEPTVDLRLRQFSRLVP